jgi:hypothetical protein
MQTAMQHFVLVPRREGMGLVAALQRYKFDQKGYIHGL